MRNTIILLFLLFLLLWSGFKGMSYLSSFAKPNTATRIAKDFENDIRQPIAEAKTKIATSKPSKKIETPKNVASIAPVKKQGEIALDAIRGKRMNTEGKLLSEKEFYAEKDPVAEKKPYEHKKVSPSTKPTTPTVAQTEAVEEMRAKGAAAIKAEKKNDFNIELGSKSKKTPSSYSKSQARIQTSASKKTTTTKKTTARKKTSSLGAYAVVGGSFSSKANALTELKRFQKRGFTKASVLTNGKLHIVALNRYQSIEDARKKVKAVKNKGIDAFVKKVK